VSKRRNISIVIEIN